jgi:hypothetical protein
MVMSSFNPTVLVGSSLALEEVPVPASLEMSDIRVQDPAHTVTLDPLGREKLLSSAFVIDNPCVMLSQSISLFCE